MRKRTGKPRFRLAPLLLLGGVLFLAAVFLPGPNGLVSILVKQRRVYRIQQEMRQFRQELDSLDARCRQLRDPAYATEYARRCLGPLPADTTHTGQ